MITFVEVLPAGLVKILPDQFPPKLPPIVCAILALIILGMLIASVRQKDARLTYVYGFSQRVVAKTLFILLLAVLVAQGWHLVFSRTVALDTQLGEYDIRSNDWEIDANSQLVLPLHWNRIPKPSQLPVALDCYVSPVRPVNNIEKCFVTTKEKQLIPELQKPHIGQCGPERHRWILPEFDESKGWLLIVKMDSKTDVSKDSEKPFARIRYYKE